MRTIYWISAVIAAFVLGIGLDRAFIHHTAGVERATALAGIERLHHLDERVTVVNDPKALQTEWADNAVRLQADGPVDIGKPAIYATDVRSFVGSPGFAIVSYKPDIRDVQVAGEWAFEWGLFDGGFRPSSGKSVEEIHGKVLRVMHRESNGEWKFARVMALFNTH
jgi:ketosteroid isomerase-like protein